MTPERWKEVEKVYSAALEHPPEDRAAFLEETCGNDMELRQEVESLLSYESRATKFIETPAFEVAAKMLAEDPLHTQVGLRIGPYHVLSFIGAGGMGEVYLTRDARLGRKVALKLLSGPLLQNPENVRRFEREARAASALNHPNILTIYDIGRSDQTHFIATEYIEGQTLRELMAGGKMEVDRTLDVAIQVTNALIEAHQAGIVHRDIKPENIMVRQDGLVKVLDFGLAMLAETRQSGEDETQNMSELKTETGIVLGTARYMSPEQARGLRADARTDLFSVGVVMYEMLTGRPPFAGETHADAIANLLAMQPPAPSQFNPEIPSALDSIVQTALRKERDERYQSAKELLAALKNLKQQVDLDKQMRRTGKVARKPDSGSHKRRARRKIDSLAVLPEMSVAADPEMEYLRDGINESIIGALSQLPKVRVMAWSTVSRYKNRQIDPREVGRELGVSAVLMARVVQLGDRLIIKTELIDAADGSHLWGDQYHLPLSDVVAIEGEIAKEISEKLLLKLTDPERKQLAKRSTEHVEAYHAYLKGRYSWNKRTAEDIRKAIEYFKQAIDIDPCYALAYAGLADCYIILGSFGIAAMPPGEAYPKAREAAMKALEIDETLAEARVSLAFCLAQYSWDWNAAEKEFKRSMEQKPGYATAHHWYGFICLVATSRLQEGILEVMRAHELDPLSLTINSDVGLLFYLSRQYDRAIAEYKKILEMDANFAYAHWKLGLAYEQKQMYEQAIVEFQKAIAPDGRSALPIAFLGHAYAASGNRNEALRVIDQLTELSHHTYVSPYRIAAIYAAFGEMDQAFDWLGRALHERDSWMVWLRFDPVFDELRQDVRLSELLRNIGSPSSRTVETPVSPKPSRASSKRKSIRSLAVLPMQNISGDPEMEYLSDGITETIINTLSHLSDLRVIARSTVFLYKDIDTIPQEIARALQVQAVVTGRVRQIGENLVIGSELIDVATDTQLWGQTFNRKMSDIFNVQEEIAAEITEHLRLKLSREEKGRLRKRHTENIEAYQANLKGRFFWNKRTTEALQKGLEYFQQAIDLDAGYASAYSGLSDSYTLLVIRQALPYEGFSRAKAAARTALNLDETLGEAHASLAHAMLHNWEWAEAEKEFKRAIELNSGYPSVHHWYSEYFLAMGRTDQCIAEAKRAKEIDPLSLIINVMLGEAFYFARQYDAAINQVRQILEIDSKFFLTRMLLGRAYAQKKVYKEAIDELQSAKDLTRDSLEPSWLLGHVFAKSGETGRARSLLAELKEQARQQYVSPCGIAMIHTALGEKDEAFYWLERAFETHDTDIFNLAVEPVYDPLRSDPRFSDLQHRMGLLR